MSSYEPPADTGMPDGEAPYDGGVSASNAPGMESGSGSYDPGMAGYDPAYADANSGMAGYDGGMGMSGYDGGMGMNGMGMGMNGQPGFVDPAPAEDDDYITKAKYAFAIGKAFAGVGNPRIRFIKPQRMRSAALAHRADP